MSGICQYLKPCTRNKRRNLPANSGRPQEIVRPGSDPVVSLASATRRIRQGEPWRPAPPGRLGSRVRSPERPRPSSAGAPELNAVSPRAPNPALTTSAGFSSWSAAAAAS